MKIREEHSPRRHRGHEEGWDRVEKMRILIIRSFLCLIFFLWSFSSIQAEIILNPKIAPAHTEAKGLPTILYSTTLSLPSPNAAVHSFIVSIFPDGSANVMQTVDNQRNLSIPAASRKISIQSFGPKILPEQAQAELQRCFTRGIPWNIPERAFVVRDPKENGFWVAELSLQTETSRRHSRLSSSEKQNPEIEENAYAFLNFLEQVRRFVCGEKSETIR